MNKIIISCDTRLSASDAEAQLENGKAFLLLVRRESQTGGKRPSPSKQRALLVATAERELERRGRLIRMIGSLDTKVLSAVLETYEPYEAVEWLINPAFDLPGSIPIEHCTTRGGAKEVLSLLRWVRTDDTASGE